MNVYLVVRWIVAGLLSTLSMDFGSALARKTGFTAGLPPRLIGRWFALLLRGRLRDQKISESPAVPGELPIALLMHYLIGISLTVVFCTLLAASPIAPTPAQGFAMAVAFGTLTNLLPWLFMFPSMGFGTFGRSGAAEWMLFRSSFINHLFFGIGIAASTYWLGILR